MAGDYDLEHIKRMFLKAAEESFGTNISFIFLSGSVAYGGGRVGHSDIDVAIILKDESYRMAHNARIDTIVGFGQQYVSIHNQTGFIPDTLFPGEIVTDGLLRDAAAGRGFSIENMEISLPPASDEYYLATAEHWFRAWLSMSAFSVFVFGDMQAWEENKILAWQTIIRYILLRTDMQSLNSDLIINSLLNEKNKWVGFGITSNYKSFRELEIHYIQKALTKLLTGKFIQVNPRLAGTYVPNVERLTQWGRETASQVNSGKIRQHALFVDIQDQLEISKRLHELA